MCIVCAGCIVVVPSVKTVNVIRVVERAVNAHNGARRSLFIRVGTSAFIFAVVILIATGRRLEAAWPWAWWGHCTAKGPQCSDDGCPPGMGADGTWYWLRSPEEERRVVAGLFNRYCTRCHGIDGRGVWDIPGVPNFTNPRWQASRSDAQIARIILEGRGSFMPPWRGTLSLEEACAMARYLRTFVPGTELARPDLHEPRPLGENPSGRVAPDEKEEEPGKNLPE